MAQVIIDDLDALKKEYAVKRKRRSRMQKKLCLRKIKVQEQEVVLLMDRFVMQRRWMDPSMNVTGKQSR